MGASAIKITHGRVNHQNQMFAKIKSGRIESQRESADYADYQKDKATQ
jgi:hypothetical protein